MVILVGLGLLVISFFVLRSGANQACPKCKKWWAEVSTGRELVARTGDFRKVKVLDKGVTSKGDVVMIQRVEQRHFTTDTIHNFFKCKNCGYAWYREESNTMED